MFRFKRALFVLLLSMTVPMFAVCLNGGTDTTIRNALGTTPNAEAVLCQGSVFSIYSTIYFTANGQKIYTEGLPDLTSQALLEASSSSVTTVISGRDRSNVELRNVIIDGKAALYGFQRGLNVEAMINLGGNATNQVIDSVEAFDTRTWSSIHTFEGSPTFSGGVWSGGCTNATVTNNWIANAGVVDAQGNWADGISHSCRNSLVADNLIQNATDGAIVVFGAPGSVIEDNTIEVTTEALGGIHLVALTYNGDYTGTIVRNNTIRAEAYVPLGPDPFLHTGITIGPRTWGDHACDSVTIKNGTVTGNYFDGPGFGYAIVVDGATNFTVTGNTLDPTFGASGDPAYTTCSGYAAAPGAFKKHGVHVTGTYQSNFVEGQLHNAAGVTPN